MQHRNTDLAREMRRRPTPEEYRLWVLLKARPMGCKFRRQAPIGNYIADFACFAQRVIIEVDGAFHANQDADIERDRWFETCGWQVLRYPNELVRRDLDAIRLDLEQRLGPATTPIDDPSER